MCLCAGGYVYAYAVSLEARGIGSPGVVSRGFQEQNSSLLQEPLTILTAEPFLQASQLNFF